LRSANISTKPGLSPLLGSTAAERVQIRAFADAVACDIHPLQNLRILRRVNELLDEDRANAWAREINREGLEACAALLPADGKPFCFGDRPPLADICLRDLRPGRACI
jgi:maleylpyruvate isomerase